jgi:hypothetical protein
VWPLYSQESSARSLSVFGDSILVIKAMIGQSNPKGSKLKLVISRIKQELTLFKRVSFFHIKQDLNDQEEDNWAKFAFELSPGTLFKNGVYDYRSIP